MSTYSLRHLGDGALVCAARDLAARERLTTAELLAHLAEIDARRLYLPAGYAAMSAWCAGELGMSEDEAFPRIRVARAAYRHPALFPMLADGRLSLTTARLLAPWLTTENAAGLLAAAAGRSRAEVEGLIAARFPRPDVPDLLMALGPATAAGGLAPERVRDASGLLVPERVEVPVARASAPLPRTDGALALAEPGPSLVPERVGEPNGLLVPERVPAPGRVRPQVAALSAGRYALQCTIDQPTHDLLRRAQALLGHAVPTGDMGMVLNRALALLVTQPEKRRFGLTDGPRGCPRRSGEADPHAIPAAIRRQVFERDGGRCTFVGNGGHRCDARTALEYDHVVPEARGGETTPGNLRLRCRAHNQHEAERAYGAGFMAHKRDEARRKREAAREAERHAREAARERERAAREAERLAQAEARECEHAARHAERLAREAEHERDRAAGARVDELVPALRNLGLSLADARLAAARAADLPHDSTLEQRLRHVLRTLTPRGTERVSFATVPAGASSSGRGTRCSIRHPAHVARRAERGRVPARRPDAASACARPGRNGDPRADRPHGRAAAAPHTRTGCSRVQSRRRSGNR